MNRSTGPGLSAGLEDGALRLLALGGLGEIGLNMLVVEYRGDLLLIDCGLMFPEAHMPGIDVVIPDITALQGQEHRLRGLVLTHGHEDHIGAVPYLLERLGFPPVYGTPLTLGLLRSRLAEHDLLGKAMLNPVEPRRIFQLGAFQVELFRAAHSIVDGVGVALRTDFGWVVHTGDFKLDPTPVDGRQTDLERLTEYGEEGVLLLLSDSTNVENRGHTLSEREVGTAFAQLMPQARGRVIVAAFASNIHRIQQAVEAAMACGRKVLIIGRSMETNTAIARDLGYLQIPDDVLVDVRTARELPRHRLAVITTGSQGEPLSTLVRMAMADFKPLPLEPGDTVILSSKFIPGNEKAIYHLINQLYRRGTEVFYETTSEVHVSGHAGRDELQQVLDLTRPRFFVPVHGEYRHLVKHAQLARSVNVAQDDAVVLENGVPLVVSAEALRTEERVPTGRVLVDGLGIGDVGPMELRDRRHLANHGLIVVLLGINAAAGEIVYGPELLSRGVSGPGENGGLLAAARNALQNQLQDCSPDQRSDAEELRLLMQRCLKRFFNRTVERRPLILPVVLEQ